MRLGQMVVGAGFCLLGLSGVAAADKPQVPMDQRVIGVERTPTERDFHESEPIRRVVYLPPRLTPPLRSWPMAEWIDRLQDIVSKGFTIPLGTVDVPE